MAKIPPIAPWNVTYSRRRYASQDYIAVLVPSQKPGSLPQHEVPGQPLFKPLAADRNTPAFLPAENTGKNGENFLTGFRQSPSVFVARRRTFSRLRPATPKADGKTQHHGALPSLQMKSFSGAGSWELRNTCLSMLSKQPDLLWNAENF